MRDEVVSALRRHAEDETEPFLAEFTRRMANDIETEASDHIPEPVFPEELA
jgi:hypothetical protein